MVFVARNEKNDGKIVPLKGKTASQRGPTTPGFTRPRREIQDLRLLQPLSQPQILGILSLVFGRLGIN